jgi:hypothetical protein
MLTHAVADYATEIWHLPSSRNACVCICSGQSRYGHLTLLRSAFEASAHAWWIVDPDIGLRTGLCRRANFTLYSHYERRKL